VSTDQDRPPNPQQMATEIIGAHFDLDDPGTSAILDQIVAALDDAGILIDPVDNGMWQNLKEGHMACKMGPNGLLFTITPAGVEHAKELIQQVGEEA
jgi:hypothetical protein